MYGFFLLPYKSKVLPSSVCLHNFKSKPWQSCEWVSLYNETVNEEPTLYCYGLGSFIILMHIS